MNMGANDALVAIKAELESQVEDLSAQLVRRDVEKAKNSLLHVKLST